MIKRLHIAGFKSILSDLDLELAPLTILTGTNSSGKSTILQSILLLKQTVENPTKSIQLVLNGRYAKLGRVQDVRANAGRPITLGFEADVVDDRNTGIEKAEAVAIRLEYGATVSDEIENIFPNAQSICIRPSNDSDWHKILKSKGVPANSLCTISISSDGLAHYKFNYTLATKAGNDTRIRKVHRQQNMIGVELNSFLPKRFHVVENIWDKVTRARLRDLDELDLPKEVLSDLSGKGQTFLILPIKVHIFPTLFLTSSVWNIMTPPEWHSRDLKTYCEVWISVRLRAVLIKETIAR